MLVSGNWPCCLVDAVQLASFKRQMYVGTRLMPWRRMSVFQCSLLLLRHFDFSFLLLILYFILFLCFSTFHIMYSTEYIQYARAYEYIRLFSSLLFSLIVPLPVLRLVYLRKRCSCTQKSCRVEMYKRNFYQEEATSYCP